MKITGFVSLLLVLAINTAFGQLAHDVSVDSILSPSPNAVILPYSGLSVDVRIKNRGTSDETYFPVMLLVTDPANELVYRDSFWVALMAGHDTVLQWGDFNVRDSGVYTFCSTSFLPNDQDSSNNSSCRTAEARLSFNAEPVSIIYPQVGDSIRVGRGFQAIVAYRNDEAKPLERTWASFYIVRYSDSLYCGDIQNFIQNLPADSILVYDTFPSSVRKAFDTRSLPTGRYELIAGIGTIGSVRKRDTSTFIIYANHDVSADSILGFAEKKIATQVSQPIVVRCTNHGRNYEPSLKMAVAIKDSLGNRVYNDTILIKNFVEGETRDIKVADWVALQAGRFTACATMLLPGDEFPSNDINCLTFNVWYAFDLQTLRIDYPESSATLQQGQPIEPIAEFRNAGIGQITTAPIRFQIRTYPNGSLVYQHDTVTGVLTPDTLLIDTCPSHQVLDNSKLPAGNYKLYAIARAPNDEFRADDTATVLFSIVQGQNAVANANSISAIKATLSPIPSAGDLNLSIELPIETNVSIDIVDETGRNVRTQPLGMLAEGSSIIPLSVASLADGWYLLRIRAGQNFLTLPLCLMR